MTARKSTSRRPAKKKACPDCKNAGQVSESFQVGGRRKRQSTDRQEALCLTCFGTGHAPD
ncbi:hypothetical protein HRW12_37220 [Streptomyces lunaelactis]|uniref:hypothetical protein n=1 Tax=Streptomyces lunaelactis TaxID=1535768 RepID=UPI0015845535|nr:hypothetical protein [Streptomyces lunaelactis]NUK39263.1 hypothetical protein [Streptomyces lunaelactis]NUK44331.1 hypothetical protein [Streptomyces lunaelactis]NUL34526.1 hypothetical protein [Streptomyces lunaelactis]